jgi:tRNA acetyltransferase TAN1
MADQSKNEQQKGTKRKKGERTSEHNGKASTSSNQPVIENKLEAKPQRQKNRRQRQKEKKKLRPTTTQEEVPHPRDFYSKKHSLLFNVPDKEKRGFLLTCVIHKEISAISSALALLKQYAKEFYPEEVARFEAKKQQQKQNLFKQDTETETEKEEKEKEQEKEQEKGKEKVQEKEKEKESEEVEEEDGLFVVYNSGGIRGLAAIEISSKNIEATQFARKIFEHPLYHERIKECNACQRLIPMDRVCLANEREILECGAAFLPNAPQFLAQEPTTYSIILEKRNNDKVDKTKLIKALANLVPERHKVQLAQPKVVVLVQIFKSVCGIAITEDYNRYARYNLHKIPQTGSSSTTTTPKEETTN